MTPLVARAVSDPRGLDVRYHRGPADVAQLVERNLAKVEVAGSNPVVRSAGRSMGRPFSAPWPSGLGKGLQNPLPGFDSRRRLRRRLAPT